MTSVVRVRRGPQTGTDSFGAPVRGPDVPTALPDALLDPGSSTELVEVGRTPVLDRPKLYWRGVFPDVKATDRLLVGGVAFDVVGTPASWPAHGAAPGGTVVELRAVEG